MVKGGWLAAIDIHRSDVKSRIVPIEYPTTKQIVSCLDRSALMDTIENKISAMVTEIVPVSISGVTSEPLFVLWVALVD